MRTRYNYLGDTTIEVVIDGDCVEVNLLPPGPVPAPAPALPLTPDPVPVAAPLELCAAAPAPTPGQRISKGGIRAAWTGVFSAGGVALVYALDNITALNLSPAIGLAVGAVGYGLKAAAFPNTKL